VKREGERGRGGGEGISVFNIIKKNKIF
jgi:hypothetical protein